MIDDDHATLQPAQSPPSRARPRGVVLTILAHPDVTRVGELATVNAAVSVSRVDPEFAPPFGAAAGLGDRHLSRKPAVRIAPVGDGVRIEPAGSVPISVGGAPVSAAVEIDGNRLERGVTLEIGDRIALLVHRRAPPNAGVARHGLIGHSEAIERVAEAIERVADLDVPVLLTGPTGAGKELVARAIHAASARAGGTLIAVSVAALTASTAASQLFGHVRGAFTGADRTHAGFFVAAHGGTLFLDEIGEVSSEIQVLLLRVLEERAVLAIGATEIREVDVRVIAATDADLEADVAAGKFKAPLLHRLAGFRIRLPPLAERPDDVGRLLAHFLREELAAAREPDRLKTGEGPPWVPASLVARLARHTWPGNVRELRNVARHIVIANRRREVVEDDEFLRSFETPAPSIAPQPATWVLRKPAEITADELVGALRAHEWRTGATAAALGISKTSLYQLMDKSDHIRKARDLSREEIERVRDETGGTLDQIAARLEVSERGLKLRLRELGLELSRS